MPQIVGKFVKMMPEVSGEKDGKAWVRTQFAIMTMDGNSKMVAFEVFGEERVAIVKSLQVGNTLIVEYTPESREYGDKFFTNLNCHRISIAQQMEQPKGGNNEPATN